MKETLEDKIDDALHKFSKLKYNGEMKYNKIDIIQFVKYYCESLYNEEDLIKASEYGYNFHKTTQFPEHEFEDSCINNTKQWILSLKKK